MVSIAGPWVLVILAVFYYASYFNNGLNLGGEGGTTAVYAMRLMEGQRPIVDTFLGYNLMWFYPVVWLFQITGPDYLALRGFFFFLCALTALLAFFTVRRVTGSGSLALLTGVLLVLVPGMLFRNYMGLMAVANQLALVSAFLLPVSIPSRRVLLIGLSGLVLGLTFLIRVEVGLFMSVIWAGLLGLTLFMPGRPWKESLRVSVLGGALAIAAFLAVHAPIAWDAHRRGYATDFYKQYTAFVGLFRWEFQKLLTPPPEALPLTPPPANAAPEIAPTHSVTPSQVGSESSRRQKPALREILLGERSRDRYFAAAIYLPVLVSGGLVIFGSLAFFMAWIRQRPDLWQDSLVVVVLTGCALTLFPQYFFFRPDTPHLVEFMIPLLPAMVCAVALTWRHAGSLLGKVLAGLAVVACVLQVWIHLGHAMPKESAGTSAARKHGPAEFVGLNNVRVKLRPDRAEALTAMQAVLVENSRPEDWIVCLPYSPTINFMTDRPSYLWDLYTDNTMAGPEFDEERIAELKKYQPAAVVIDHRAINNSEQSRLPNWAPQFYAYLHKNYDRAGEYAGNEVFLKRPMGTSQP
jgi:hypothetical protein